MSQTSYTILSSQNVILFPPSRIYDSFLFIQSHFITKLIKTDERDSLVIFIFLIAHPLCFWLWMLSMYDAPVKEENCLCLFSLVHQWKFWKSLLSNSWNIKMSAQMFPGRNSLVNLSNVTVPPHPLTIWCWIIFFRVLAAWNYPS